jgi:dTDP-4-dehydrorhamnose 3,5-epimerase
LVRELAVEGALEITPVQHDDDRGVFLEWFREDAFAAATGHSFRLAQANCSVSRAGTVRGIHFAQLPPSQAKFVTCVHGAALDVVIDLREGSPTFGQWDSVHLDDRDRRAIYLPEGLGHAFMALSDGTVVNYLCSAPYAPEREHAIHPLDPELAIAWPTQGVDGSPLTPLLSPKDDAAPGLAEVRRRGLLATYEDARAFTRSLVDLTPRTVPPGP